MPDGLYANVAYVANTLFVHLSIIDAYIVAVLGFET